VGRGREDLMHRLILFEQHAAETATRVEMASARVGGGPESEDGGEGVQSPLHHQASYATFIDGLRRAGDPARLAEERNPVNPGTRKVSCHFAVTWRAPPRPSWRCRRPRGRCPPCPPPARRRCRASCSRRCPSPSG